MPSFPQSRTHLLNRSAPSNQFYLKRDDELSFGISGTKLRKYHSMVPALIDAQVERVAVIGGKNSNNVLGLAQALTENQIAFEFFLCGSKEVSPNSNFAMVTKLWPKIRIHWIDNGDWPNAVEIAKVLSPSGTVVIPEGGHMRESVLGASSLADDIIRNETDLGTCFNHIFLDSGTGNVAASAALRLAQLKHPATIHVVQLAEKEECFWKACEQIVRWGCYDKEDLWALKKTCSVIRPITSKSFGSTNRQVFDFIQMFAAEEGVILDPIYSAKSIMTAFHLIESQSLTGPHLLLHSGGAQSIYGFLNQM